MYQKASVTEKRQETKGQVTGAEAQKQELTQHGRRARRHRPARQHIWSSPRQETAGQSRRRPSMEGLKGWTAEF